MKTLQGISGVWAQSQQMVTFKWQPDGSNNRYVHIIGLTENNGKLQLDDNCYTEKDLKFAMGKEMLTISISVNSGAASISKKGFFAFSTLDSYWDRGEVQTIINKSGWNSPYVVAVAIGHASLQYGLISKRAGLARSVTFVLSSTSGVPEGVLGYRYQCGDTEITLPFPGDIPAGKKRVKYGPILIPFDSEIKPIPMNEQYTSNVDIQRKTMLGGLF